MDDDLTSEFLIEGFETLDELDQQLIELEKSPGDQERLRDVFRHVHTIKGTCGFLGFDRLESVTHVGENLLSRLRDGHVEFTSEITTAILELLDAMREMMGIIESTGSDGDKDYSALIEKLSLFAKGGAPSEAQETTEEVEEEANEGEPPVSPAQTLHTKIGTLTDKIAKDPSDLSSVNELNQALNALEEEVTPLSLTQLDFLVQSAIQLTSKMPEHEIQNIEGVIKSLAQFQDAVSEILVAHAKDGTEGSKDYFHIVTALQTSAEQLGQAEQTKTAIVEESAKEELVQVDEADAEAKENVKPAKELKEEETAAVDEKVKADKAEDVKEKAVEKKTPAQAANKTVSVAETSLRVDVRLLDDLMNRVGELVLVRNQIIQYSNAIEDGIFSGATQRLNLVTTELQEGVMKTRMQPIMNVWNKFPRLVRDLARQCGKKIRIEMQGKETELDKTIIESIKDPLTHMVRNSVDHGIESPEEREAAGKEAEGVMILRAFHEGGQVLIEIEDDGAGINPEKIRKRVVEKELVSADQVAQMSDSEVIKLIFLPGFSTAEKVTNVSGRGVGMDVVRTNIEKIGGLVDIRSTYGQGSTVVLKIPLTLAIIPALMVTSGGNTFAIPQVSLLELIRIHGKNITSSIESIKEALFYRLRGNLIPLISLNDILAIEGASSTDKIRSYMNEEGANLTDKAVNVVVLKADERQFGLLVDNINDSGEIVVKPLGKQFKKLPLYAGATILGDGRVSLILDVMAISQRARIASASHLSIDEKQTVIETDHQSILIFSVGSLGRMAVPLAIVDRLEEFSTSKTEKAGGLDVIQYRGDIMPLLSLPNFFGTEAKEKDNLHVVVYSRQGKSVGLVVDEICDIVEDKIVPEKGVTRDGIVYSAIIQDKVTEFIDILGIIERMNPSFFKAEQETEAVV